MRDRRVLISGSTGLLGTAVSRAVREAGGVAGALARPGSKPGASETVTWEPRTGPADLGGWDAVVHLAGLGLMSGIWTRERKRRIRESRVVGTRGIAEAMASRSDGPRTLVCASAVGFYGDRGDEILHEGSAPGSGYLAELCRDWERATDPAREAGVRVVNLRFGIVFASTGPLATMALPFRLGLGGRLGDGRQYFPWVAREDAVAAVTTALGDERWRGPVNVVAPQAITNSELTRALGRVLRRPTILPVPAFILRTLPGGMGTEAFLASQRVEPRRLTELGFRWELPELLPALRAALGG